MRGDKRQREAKFNTKNHTMQASYDFENVSYTKTAMAILEYVAGKVDAIQYPEIRSAWIPRENCYRLAVVCADAASDELTLLILPRGDSGSINDNDYYCRSGPTDDDCFKLYYDDEEDMATLKTAMAGYLWYNSSDADVTSEETGAVFEPNINAKVILEYISQRVPKLQKPRLSVEFVPEINKEVLAVTCDEYNAWDSYIIIVPSDVEGAIDANAYYMRCQYDHYKLTADDYDLSSLDAAMRGLLWPESDDEA